MSTLSFLIISRSALGSPTVIVVLFSLDITALSIPLTSNALSIVILISYPSTTNGSDVLISIVNVCLSYHRATVK